MQFASTAVSAPGQVPVSEAAASRETGSGSWYARQRDLAQTSNPTGAGPTAETSSPFTSATLGEPEPLIRSSLTRPQEPGTLQPTVIQWQSSPPAPPASGAVPPPLVALPARSLY